LQAISNPVVWLKMPLFAGKSAESEMGEKEKMQALGRFFCAPTAQKRM
jgi:hypothetical protein